MRAGMWVALAAVVAVAGCGAARDSRLNPMNWFGSSQSVQAVAGPSGQVALDDGLVQVAEVTQLHVEPTKGGAIIRAVGVPATQGWYRAELRRETSAEGTLSYSFLLKAPPPEAARLGTPLSREVTVATFVSDFQLSGVSTVTVTGALNGRSTGRR